MVLRRVRRGSQAEGREDHDSNTAESSTHAGDALAILLAEVRNRGARMLRLRDVMARTTLARNTIHEMEVRGEFPQRRRLAGNGDRVGWLESEIEDWIKTRPTEEEARKGRKSSRCEPACPGTGLPAESVRVLGVPHPMGTCAVCAKELRLDGAGRLPEHGAILAGQPVPS